MYIYFIYFRKTSFWLSGFVSETAKCFEEKQTNENAQRTTDPPEKNNLTLLRDKMPLSGNKDMLFVSKVGVLKNAPRMRGVFVYQALWKKCDIRVVSVILFLWFGLWFGLVALSTCHHVEDADKVGNIHNPIAIDVGTGIGNSF